MRDDLAELRRLAEKATPVTRTRIPLDGGADWDLVEAMTPATVIALLDALEAADRLAEVCSVAWDGRNVETVSSAVAAYRAARAR